MITPQQLCADGTTTPEHKEYTYDEQGNMLTDGTRNFAYDAMNRLSQVTTTEGNTQKNRYDGEGLRAEMEENGRLVNFLFDGEKVIAETDGDQNVIRYIRGYDLISSDSEKAKTYYHYASDEMGSITHVIDEAGNVCNHYEYDAFGDFTVKEETVQNRFGFTGEQFDPVAGLYYLRARFYNPVIGRFIQEDTYYGDGLNLYAYCANNPVKYIDPSGHEACLQKQEAINQLKEAGLSPEEAEKYYNHLRKSNSADVVSEQIKKKFGNQSGKTTDFYVTPNGDVVPATGYRYMDSGRANDALTTGEQYTTYIGFTKYDSASQVKDAFQIADMWSDCKIRGEFDTLQVVDKMYVPTEKGNTTTIPESITCSYPNYGNGGEYQLCVDTVVKFDSVVVIGAFL